MVEFTLEKRDVDMSGTDSSSEEEDTAKLREAVWSGGAGAPSTWTDGEKNDKQSKRVDRSKHDEDGNELQTTPEFRSHVAKRLGAILDSRISEVSRRHPDSKLEATSKENAAAAAAAADDDDGSGDGDEGFRVFSTSLPGKWWKAPSPPLVPKRPPVPSSSDSDSEMELRLREAAVSVSDLIGPPSTENMKEKEKIFNRERDEGDKVESAEAKKKKKKKKKKKNACTERAEEGESLLKGNESVACKQETHEQITEEQAMKMKKKKKKKRIKLDEGE